MFKVVVFMFLAVATSGQSQGPVDYYHWLHLPHNPPLYPTWPKAPLTSFSCDARPHGYYADVQSGCQAFHLCWRNKLVATNLCANGTVFNEQFQVCDYFYNVRCGSLLEDI